MLGHRWFKHMQVSFSEQQHFDFPLDRNMNNNKMKRQIVFFKAPKHHENVYNTALLVLCISKEDFTGF